MTKPNYGLDAPGAVRNLFIVAGLGLIALVTRLLHLWDSHSPVARIGRPLMAAGAGCLLMAIWMIYDSMIGKVRERGRQLDRAGPWRGDERVLDIGCGRGLFLVAAAQRLDASRGGRAIGIDLWQAEDLSGNTPEAALENARLEGVADRIEVKTGDARRLPFDDSSFDVVVSSMALHNIYDAAEREQAIREIARVLKKAGRVLIVDIRHCPQYAAVLRDAGLSDARYHKGIADYLFIAISFGSSRSGYVKATREAAMNKSQ